LLEPVVVWKPGEYLARVDLQDLSLKTQNEMTMEKALQLLAQSRQIHWSYLTSQGRPVKWDAPEDWVREIVGKKQAIVLVGHAKASQMEGDNFYFARGEVSTRILLG
jgi:hypothetical protein